jgi:xanthine/CO dehydrogenase XdhC/CoxF family maturation factor
MLDTPDPHAIGRFVRAAPAILVTVDNAKGSTPRMQGTQMLVSATAVLGTIGGGQLEYMAIDAARAMLNADDGSQRLTIPLGPEIGQCCGGQVISFCLSATPGRRKTLHQVLRWLIKNNLPFTSSVQVMWAEHWPARLCRCL